ncbi:hypothetical protein [Metabacillus fastidiosus]|uniref:hypothetical protein n=1 Tax=Metabacillus fastidiosus TaxID=1458 RepID=UPI003D2BAB91
MKKTFISAIVTLTSLFILTSCSNNEYEKLMEKGLKSLGEKDYHQAAIYFESALLEKEGEKDASSYFTQANEMETAIQAYKKKEFDEAIDSLDRVIDEKDGLQTLQTEATTFKKQIFTEKELITSVEKKLIFIKDLLKKNNNSEAQEQLQLLQKEINSNKLLANYQSEVSKQLEKVQTDSNNSEEEPTKIEENKEEQKISYQTYTNGRFGFSVQHPSNFMIDPPPTNGDGAVIHNEELEITAFGSHTNVISQNETIDTYYKEDLQTIDTEIAYKKLTDKWYVLSYIENGTIIYKKFFFGDEVSNTLILTYPESQKEKYDPVVTHIAKTFGSSAE